MWRLGLKIIGVGGLIALLIWGGSWVWQRPERWNGTAKDYLGHVQALQSDSKRWDTDRAAFVGQHNRDKRTIDSLKNDVLTWKGLAEACQSKADQALSQFEALPLTVQNALLQVGSSVGLMNRKDQQIAALKAMVANKSVPASRLADTTKLTGDDLTTDAEIESGALKTALWLKVYQNKFDSTARVAAVAVGQVDTYKQQRDQATLGEQRAVASSLYAEGTWLKEARTRRPLGKGRKKNAVAQADSVRRIRERPATTQPVPVQPGATAVETESDLEKELN